VLLPVSTLGKQQPFAFTLRAGVPDWPGPGINIDINLILTPEKYIKQNSQDYAQHNTSHYREEDGEITLLDEDISGQAPGKATPGDKEGDPAKKEQYDASG